VRGKTRSSRCTGTSSGSLGNRCRVGPSAG
jgi:hypothetical protein